MSHFEYFTRKFLFALSIIVILDILIKLFIVSTFAPAEVVSFLGGIISIGYIKSQGMLLFPVGDMVLAVIKAAFLITMILIFIKVQSSTVSKYYKYAVSLILFGWLGNYIDTLLISSPLGAYQIDYLYIIGINSYKCLSSLMSISGWILLVFTALFGKSASKIVNTSIP